LELPTPGSLNDAPALTTFSRVFCLSFHFGIEQPVNIKNIGTRRKNNEQEKLNYLFKGYQQLKYCNINKTWYVCKDNTTWYSASQHGHGAGEAFDGSAELHYHAPGENLLS